VHLRGEVGTRTWSEILLRRIHDALNRKGRLVIVDKFAPSKIGVPPSPLLSAFLTSLESPAQSVDYIATGVVHTQLQQAGFRILSPTRVPHNVNLPWNIDWIMIAAQK